MESGHGQLRKGPIQIDLLKQILPIEYEFVKYYEYLVPRVDKETGRKVRQLIEESINHAKVIAEFLQSLDTTIDIEFTQVRVPESQDSIIDMFKRQLENEKLVRWLQLQAAEYTENGAYREQLLRMASQEDTHIELVESIVVSLEQSAQG